MQIIIELTFLYINAFFILMCMSPVYPLKYILSLPVKHTPDKSLTLIVKLILFVKYWGYCF